MEESTAADPGHRHAQTVTRTQRVPQNHTHTSTDLPLNLHGAREVITIQNTWKQG